jgi:uncharacterized protein YegL
MEDFEQRGINEEIPKIIATSEPHMALVFLLDTSGSMNGDPIESLNKGLNRFKVEVCQDKQTRDRLDVAIVEFNDGHRVVQDFTPVEYMDPIDLTASGRTNMASAIETALNMVDERSRLYRQTGTVPYKPWAILISDGTPTDDISAVAQRIKDMEEGGKVNFLSLGVGEYDSRTLHTLSSKVMKLIGTDFKEFFNWVSKSMRSVSQSTPGERPSTVRLEGNVERDYQDTDDFF